MKRAIFYTSDTEGPQPNWGGPFIEGLRRHGWSADIVDKWERCDLFVLWGARRDQLIAKAEGKGAEVCVLERAYLGDRFQWLSVSFGGGLNGRAEFRGPFSDPSRWQKHFAPLMQPWRTTPGQYALIMQQIPTDTACRNVDLSAFYADVAYAFARDIQVRTRAHPNVNPKHGQERIDAARQSLDRDLADAEFVITWNSNSAVDAVMAGVPAIAMDPGSMAWDVTGHELKRPPRPDRMRWAHAMAWKQWNKAELASGACWDAVGRERVAA